MAKPKPKPADNPTPKEVEEAKDEVEEAKEEVEEAKEEVETAETPAEEEKAEEKLNEALSNLSEKQLSAKEIEDAVHAGTKRALDDHVTEQNEARRLAEEQEDKPVNDPPPPTPDPEPGSEPETEPATDTQEPKASHRWFGRDKD